jgi:hypothetical protein
MTWAKQRIVDQAYDELALSGYIFDLTPEEYAFAGRKLETMVAMWGADGISLPYSFDASEDPDLTAESGLSLSQLEAVYLGLAKRIAASKGKQLMPSTLTAAHEAKNALIAQEVQRNVGQMQQKSGMPMGAGWKSYGNIIGAPFSTPPDTSPVRLGEGGGMELNGA